MKKPPLLLTALCATVALYAATVGAQTPLPRVQPSRDVVVLYAVDGPAVSLLPGGIDGPVRLSWDALGQRLRAEADGRNQVALIDLRTHAGQVIDTALRVALPLKLHAGDLQALTLDGVRLERGGRETVAGLACTDYRFDSAQGPGTVCLTADGVPLRGQGMVRGKVGTFTARSVRYGLVSPALFEVPAGYMALSMPGGQAGTMNGVLSGALGALMGRRSP